MKHLISMDLADSDNFALAVYIANQCKPDDKLIIAISPRHCNYSRTSFVIENGKVNYEEYSGVQIEKKNCSQEEFFSAPKRLWRKKEEQAHQNTDTQLHARAMLADLARLLEKTKIQPEQLQLIIGQAITDAVSDTIIAPEYAFLTIDEQDSYRLRTPSEFLAYKKEMLDFEPARRRELRIKEANKKIEYFHASKFAPCAVNTVNNQEEISKVDLTSEQLTIYAAGPMTFIAELEKRAMLPKGADITFKGMMFTRDAKANLFGDNFNLVVDPGSAQIVINRIFPKCSTVCCFPTEIFKGSNIYWACLQKGQIEGVLGTKQIECYGLSIEALQLIQLYNIGTGNIALLSEKEGNCEALTKPVFDLALALPVNEKLTSQVSVEILPNNDIYGGVQFKVSETNQTTGIHMLCLEKMQNYMDINKGGALFEMLSSTLTSKSTLGLFAKTANETTPKEDSSKLLVKISKL